MRIIYCKFFVRERLGVSRNYILGISQKVFMILCWEIVIAIANFYLNIIILLLVRRLTKLHRLFICRVETQIYLFALWRVSFPSVCSAKFIKLHANFRRREQCPRPQLKVYSVNICQHFDLKFVVRPKAVFSKRANGMGKKWVGCWFDLWEK